MKAGVRFATSDFKLRTSGLRFKVPALSIVVRVVIGATLCLSGLLKLVNHHEFEEALSGYGFLPGLVVEIVTLLLPQVEVCLGILLAFGVKEREISAFIAVMLVAFTSVGAVSWALGNRVDCGCFPVAGRMDPIGGLFFVRNGLLVIGCLYIFLKQWRLGEKLPK
jgi:uncharacterized membrane protein YphA (DoxX/SURF4 family)